MIKIIKFSVLTQDHVDLDVNPSRWPSILFRNRQTFQAGVRKVLGWGLIDFLLNLMYGVPHRP